MTRVAVRRLVGDWCWALVFFAAFGLVDPLGEWLGTMLGGVVAWLAG